MKICYFDCFAGAAGDMVLGALLDLGVEQDVVDRAVGALGIEGWSLSVEETSKRGLRATRVRVHAEEQMRHRSLADIESLLESSDLAPQVRTLARAAFRTLAEAEAGVHGVDVEEVEFHEVGALDAIVDIVGSCAAFADLSPERTIVSSLPMGSGTVQSGHGVIPVPAPAVTAILSGAEAPIVAGGEGETVTPTGAALLVTFADAFGEVPPMRLDATGYGAGERDTLVPNLVRVLCGELTQANETAFVIEANIDDMSPELLAHACERLLQSGAGDAWLTPIVMKKGRAAQMLSAMVAPDKRDSVLDVLFAETSTLGARVTAVVKEMLERDNVTVEVRGQVVRVKLGVWRGRVVNRAPEFEDARAAAQALGLPLKEVYALALEQARDRA